ncbi:hypothetical protein [Pectinatus brassicae]|uniref:Uncharacterized protein n=1 Tax=Pectinatus brassicae TaxID=862415 RepID=A0A840UMI4_9FIRM|nr:hypothetical protein [Pectinatus brassicae]MBB5337420.1 hypothetical protein [Pectinatus brassicae]
MINEDVKKVLTECMWDLATCSNNQPNVIPVARQTHEIKFKQINGK